MKNSGQIRSYAAYKVIIAMILLFCGYSYLTNRVNTFDRLHNKVGHIKDILQNSADCKSSTLQSPADLAALARSCRTESHMTLDGRLASKNAVVKGFEINKIFPRKVMLDNGSQVCITPISPGSASAKSNYSLTSSQSLNSQFYSQPTFTLENVNYNRSVYSKPRITEYGSYYGQISQNTGCPETVDANGYYRRDGTYVSSH